FSDGYFQRRGGLLDRSFDFLRRREGLNLLLDLRQWSWLRRGWRGRAGPPALGDPLLQYVDLVVFEAAKLVLDVVAEVPAIVQDGLGFKAKAFGQFEDPIFLESLCRQAVLLRGVPRAPPRKSRQVIGMTRSIPVFYLTGSTDPGGDASWPSRP